MGHRGTCGIGRHEERGGGAERMHHTVARADVRRLRKLRAGKGRVRTHTATLLGAVQVRSNGQCDEKGIPTSPTRARVKCELG